MEEILQFVSEQYIIISAIVIVVVLIAQELISESRGSQYELTPEETAVMCFKGAKIIDIREKSQYKEAHISKAIWLSAKQLELYPEKALKPKQAYVLYCSDGNQSGELSRSLRKKSGYEVYFINEGMDAWRKAGMNLAPNTH